MKLKEFNGFQEFIAKEMKLGGINMKIIENENAKQVVIFCPGFPESTGFNDNLINDISNRYNVSCIYPQYAGTRGSDGEFLEHNPSADIENIVQYIRGGKIIKNKDSHITLIGSSFGGGIALDLSWNKDVEKIIALSPLTDRSGKVDREGLYSFIKNSRPEYRINEEGYKRLINGNLLKIPQKYPEGKVVVGAVKGDPEIDFERLLKEADSKSASFLDKIILDEKEKKHLSRNVINRLNTSIKEEIFKSIDVVNERIDFIDLFLTSLFEKVSHEEVYGVMSHGSRLFKEGGARDFDFILVFNKVQESDFATLQHIKSRFLEQGINNLDITIVYMDKLNIGGVRNFNLSTHGNYYAEVLSAAKTLYGHNPFENSLGNELTKHDIIQGFRSEIGKYTDRLNREILSNDKNPIYFKKYIERMVLSLSLAEGATTVFKSNYFELKDVPNFLKRLKFDGGFIAQLTCLLSKEYWDKSDWSLCYSLYNTLHIRALEFSKKNITNAYLKNMLSGVCNITNNISVSCSNEQMQIVKPTVKIISCAGFEAGNWHRLESNQEKINAEQLNRLSQSNIVLQQIKQYFDNNYGEHPGTEILFGDYGVNVENGDELLYQYDLNKKTCSIIYGDIKYKKLSDDFGIENYTRLDFYTIENIKNIMLGYGLKDDFVVGYLNSSIDYMPNVLDMVGLSISEHLNLIDQVINKRENSILIYIGNSQKIRLMNEVIKARKHSNILVGINT